LDDGGCARRAEGAALHSSHGVVCPEATAVIVRPGGESGDAPFAPDP